MARAPGTRSTIAEAVLKGILLEEAVAFLIGTAGYRLLTVPSDDPHDLHWMGNGLQVRGRGGYHQVDVLGELSWAPAFGSPVRLFLEAKWRERASSTVGIRDVRHAVGIMHDVNQLLSTVEAPAPGGRERDGDDVHAQGRAFSYVYRYALCSVSGFSKGAQAFALAHQVSLLDLSNDAFLPLRQAIAQSGAAIYRRLDQSGASDSPTGRPDPSEARSGIVRRLRETMRQALWEGGEVGNPAFLDQLWPLIDRIHDIGELFVAVSATGFVVLLKADDPEAFVACMRAPVDPYVELHWNPRQPLDWTMTIQRTRHHEQCQLEFSLPEVLLRSLEAKEERGRRHAALGLKDQHFSRMTVYRITPEKTLICTLRLDRRWLSDARTALDRRRDPSGRIA